MENTELQEKVARLEGRVEELERRLSEASAPERKRLLTIEEAAAFLGMTVVGVRGLTYRKVLSYYKPNGKNIYFDGDELAAWQKQNHMGTGR